MFEEVDCAFYGTQLKYTLTIKASGFDMQADEFSLTLQGKTSTKTIEKSEMIYEADGAWTFILDTNDFGKGLVELTVKAVINDDDFNGKRVEIVKRPLLRILA